MSLTIVNHLEDVKIEVCINRAVTVGGEYHIAPSMGYAGIEQGTVRVLAIGNLDNDSIALTHRDDIDEFIRVEMDLYGDDPYASTRKHNLESGYWVVYRNLYSEDTLPYVFPLEEFIDHTTNIL